MRTSASEVAPGAIRTPKIPSSIAYETPRPLGRAPMPKSGPFFIRKMSPPSLDVERPALHRTRRFEEKLPRLHVPEDRQPYEDDGDDPQNDVFTAVLFFCHRRSTAHLKFWFKCRVSSTRANAGNQYPSTS